MSDSLLDQPAQALLPFDDLDGPPAAPCASIEEASRLPVWTGARFFERYPERYRLFCAIFFEAGLGQMEACRLLRMSPQTGASIIRREMDGMSAEAMRQYQVKQARAVVSQSLSAMLEGLTDPERVRGMSQRDHAQAAKVAHEIASLLDGQATSRVERRGDPDEQQRAAELLRSLGGAARPIQAEEIGPDREARAGAAGAPAALAAPLEERAGVALEGGALEGGAPCRDLQSRHDAVQVAQLQGVARGDAACYTRSDTREAGTGALEGGA